MNALAGLSLGVVIGWFAGLSASPVVGALIAALSSAGMAYLSLRHTPDAAALSRIVGFSLGCVVAATAGVYVRANDLLGMTPKRALAHWRAAGVEPAALSRHLDTYLARQITMGRTLVEITTSMPASAPPAENHGGAKGETGGKDDDAPARAVPSVVHAGFGAMFSQPDADAVLACLDQLEKRPAWADARRAYLAIPRASVREIAWIDASRATDPEKVAALTVWLKSTEPGRNREP